MTLWKQDQISKAAQRVCLAKYNGEMKAHKGMRPLSKLCMRSLATCLLNLPLMLLCCCFQWTLTKRKTCFQRRHLIKVYMPKKYVFFHHRQEYSVLLMLKAVAAIATVVKVQSNSVCCWWSWTALSLHIWGIASQKGSKPWFPLLLCMVAVHYSHNCKQINMV